jgi:hypothetical protein
MRWVRPAEPVESQIKHRVMLRATVGSRATRQLGTNDLNHLRIQEAARRKPHDAMLRERLALSLRRIIDEIAVTLLREGPRGGAELREEVAAVGFVAVWEKQDDIIHSFFDDEQQYLWHVESISRYPMEKARDDRCKPAGVGHDRRRMEAREAEQNDREQVAGHAMPARHRRAGGGVESRSCLNSHDAWGEASDDLPEVRERRRPGLAT